MAHMSAEDFQRLMKAVQSGQAFLITAETETQIHKGIALAENMETAAVKSLERLVEMGEPVIWLIAEPAGLDEALEWLATAADSEGRPS